MYRWMLRFVKLKCRSCTSETCYKKPIGSIATEKEGCIKEVGNLDADKYFHYVIEVWPELRKRKNPRDPQWNDLEEFLQYIHDLPPGERYK